MYVLAPEKFVAMAAFDPDKSDLWVLICPGGFDNNNLANRIYLGGVLGGVLLDLCGVGALVAGLAGPVLPPAALAVGYAATALGGLCAIVLFIPSILEE